MKIKETKKIQLRKDLLFEKIMSKRTDIFANSANLDVDFINLELVPHEIQLAYSQSSQKYLTIIDILSKHEDNEVISRFALEKLREVIDGKFDYSEDLVVFLVGLLIKFSENIYYAVHITWFLIGYTKYNSVFFLCLHDETFIKTLFNMTVSGAPVVIENTIWLLSNMLAEQQAYHGERHSTKDVILMHIPNIVQRTVEIIKNPRSRDSLKQVTIWLISNITIDCTETLAKEYSALVGDLFEMIQTHRLNYDFHCEIFLLMSNLSSTKPESFEAYKDSIIPLAEYLFYDKTDNTRLVYLLKTLGNVFLIDNTKFTEEICFNIKLFDLLQEIMKQLDYTKDKRIINEIVITCTNSVFDVESAYSFTVTYLPKYFMDIYKETSSPVLRNEILQCFNNCFGHQSKEISSNILHLPALELYSANIRVDSDIAVLISSLKGLIFILRYGEITKYRTNIYVKEVESLGVVTKLEDLMLNENQEISGLAKKIHIEFFTPDEEYYNGSV